MTKQEFIQEAALRMISVRPDAPMCEILAIAVSLANCVYGRKEPEMPSGLNKEPVQTILDEIIRMEACEKAEFEANRKSPYNWYQRKGYATILHKAFVVEGVRTVGDMLKRGRIGCLKMRKVGRKSVEQIDRALLNLYGIKKW